MSDLFLNDLDFKRTTVAEACGLELRLERGPTQPPIAVRLAAPSASALDSDLFASDARLSASQLLDVVDCAAPFKTRRVRADQLRVVGGQPATIEFGPLFSMCLVLATGSVAALAFVYVLLFMPGQPIPWAALPDAHPLRGPLRMHAELVLSEAESSLGAPASVLWRVASDSEPVRQLVAAYGSARTVSVAACDSATIGSVRARLDAARAPLLFVFERACGTDCQHALTDLLDDSQRQRRAAASAVFVLLGCGGDDRGAAAVMHDRLKHRIKHEI